MLRVGLGVGLAFLLLTSIAGCGGTDPAPTQTTAPLPGQSPTGSLEDPAPTPTPATTPTPTPATTPTLVPTTRMSLLLVSQGDGVGRGGEIAVGINVEPNGRGISGATVGIAYDPGVL